LFRLEDSREFERAAAIAVFTLKVTRAIEVLRHGAVWRQSHRTSLHCVVHLTSIFLFSFWWYIWCSQTMASIFSFWWYIWCSQTTAFILAALL